MLFDLRAWLALALIAIVIALACTIEVNVYPPLPIDPIGEAGAR